MFQTYIDCLHLKTTGKSRMDVENPMDTEDGASTKDDETPKTEINVLIKSALLPKKSIYVPFL